MRRPASTSASSCAGADPRVGRGRVGRPPAPRRPPRRGRQSPSPLPSRTRGSPSGRSPIRQRRAAASRPSRSPGSPALSVNSLEQLVDEERVGVDVGVDLPEAAAPAPGTSAWRAASKSEAPTATVAERPGAAFGAEREVDIAHIERLTSTDGILARDAAPRCRARSRRAASPVPTIVTWRATSEPCAVPQRLSPPPAARRHCAEDADQRVFDRHRPVACFDARPVGKDPGPDHARRLGRRP